ncbi:sialate O-acetylesterase [Agathobacter sp.]|uniref:sialate O-acetylesterase n=1 Tax=Agathobacter sp. TaxID=2021311 RepID=UPI003FD88B94
MLKTAMIFGNHMTLQREKEIAVWGWADFGTEITVNLSGNTACASTREDGTWQVTLPPISARTGLTMTVTNGAETLTYEDVRIGEVWLAGGQSNMEYFLQFDEEWESAKQTQNPDITFFDYPEVSYEEQLAQRDYSRFGIWRKCEGDNLPYYSAVGFYFAKVLQKTLKVPVGIVGCNWGGTPACAWMDTNTLEGTQGECWLNEYENGLKTLDIEAYQKEFLGNPRNDHSNPFEETEEKKKSNSIFYPGLKKEAQEYIMQMMEKYHIPMNGPVGPWSERRPGGLYHTMLKKIAPFAMRGVIFYQGESDSPHPEQYEFMLTKLIGDWRALWKEELPFLMVQLAPFEQWLAERGDSYPMLRNAQEAVSEKLPAVWMCSSSDAGMQWDIHPKKKRSVGERLALLAQGHIYGKKMLCDPPELEKAYAMENGICFEMKNGFGLSIDGESLNALCLKDKEGKQFEIEKVETAGNRLFVYGSFPKEMCAEFAFTPYYEVNLYNEAGNPAKPFKVNIR